MSIIPDNNVAGKSKINRSFLETDDWKAAKEHSGKAAADRVVDELWSDKKTSDLKAYFQDPTNVVFITVPSTSGKNVVPLRLAEKLSKEFNGRAICGDEFFSAVHSRQSKHIPWTQRAFYRREYVPENIDTLKKETAGKQIVVVEDILTTGGSAAVFCMTLDDEGIEVQSVAALMGDKRLNIDLKTQARLEAALNQAGLSFDSEALTARLTRVEAGGLVMQINSARLDNAKQKLTQNLYGLLDQRPFKDVGRDPAAARYPGAQRADLGDEKISEAISPWPVRADPGRLTHYEIIVKCSGAEYKKPVSLGPDIEKPHEFLSGEAKRFASKVAAKNSINDLKIIDVKVNKVDREMIGQPEILKNDRCFSK